METIKYVWIILNSILILYIFILLIYSIFFRKEEEIQVVINLNILVKSNFK